MVNLKNKEYKSFFGKKWVYLVLVALLIVSIGSYIFINALTNNIISSTSYDISLNVGDYVGLNTDTDKIYFGTIPKGGNSYREINVNSADEGFLYLTVQGEISDVIYIQNPTGVIGKNETVFNLIIAKIPSHYKEGSYEAKLRVFVLKKEDSFLNLFLPGTKIRIFDEQIENNNPNIAIEIINNKQNDLI